MKNCHKLRWQLISCNTGCKSIHFFFLSFIQKTLEYIAHQKSNRHKLVDLTSLWMCRHFGAKSNFYGAHLLMIRILGVAFFMILIDYHHVSYQSWAVFYIYIVYSICIHAYYKQYMQYIYGTNFLMLMLPKSWACVEIHSWWMASKFNIPSTSSYTVCTKCGGVSRVFVLNLPEEGYGPGPRLQPSSPGRSRS